MYKVLYNIKENILQLFDFITKFIFPPRCIKCWEINEDYDNLCIDCWKSIKFISGPQCKICGHPFLYGTEDETYTCYYCLKDKKAKSKVIIRSLMHHNKESSPLIFKLKYQDRLEIGKFLGRMVNTKYNDILQDVDIVTPVPIHKLKLIARKYNQSAIIVNYIELAKDKKILDLLFKVKNTKSQVNLTYKERLINVQDSVEINTNKYSLVKGKKILIIDDVMTTGETLRSCTKKLIKAGAKKIYCITITRVCRQNINYVP